MDKDKGLSSQTDGAELLQPPASVLEIARRLIRAGHESWFVGGAVRDALLGHPNLDWDLATAATPPQVQRLFRRTVPVGIEFGTVGVLDDAGVMHEVTTFRRDVRTDGRHAVVEFGASLEEDLARRDFTINAIAYGPDSRELRDPFRGRGDLEHRLVRAVGVAADRMREDRLRALRAIRFAARFQFAIEAETWSAILESAPHLGRLSMERVQQEIEKTMVQVDRPGSAFRMWRDSGALAVLAPPLASLSDVALATLDRLPRARGTAQSQRTANRMTALFLELTPAVARATLRELRFSNDRMRWIGDFVERWHTVSPAMRDALLADTPPSDATVRRWVAAIGRTRVGAFLRVAEARFGAELDEETRAVFSRAMRSLYRRAWRVALRDPVETGDLALDGGDLMKAGIKAGPQLGAALRSLLDWVLEDPARNTHDQLLARARELAADQSHA
ncbi:MAG: Polynucleotide adenylyltransferase region [Gemmatimonadetes bacterium]|nr:Polynucleotide adenylyltransferase region [Gemmatimonadota bacterium]